MSAGNESMKLSRRISTGSIPPSKDDLSRFYINQDTTSGGDQVLDLAWERTNLLGSARYAALIVEHVLQSNVGEGSGA